MRRASLAGLFTLVFIVGGQMLQLVLPWPDEHDLRAKHEHVRTHGDDYDIVIFGSSRTYRALVPAVMADRLVNQGIEARAFNFGLPGANAFEVDHLLREVLTLRPAELDLVVVELLAWNVRSRDLNARSARSVHWHSTRQTVAVLRHLADAGLGGRTTAEVALSHLHAWGWQQALFGQGWPLVDAVIGPPSAAVTEDGYAALEDSEEFRSRRSAFIAKPAGLRRRLKRLADPPDRAREVPPRWLESWQRQIALVREHGAELVFIIPPGTVGPDGWESMAENHTLPHLLTYNRPEEHPELHRPGAYFDENHLSRPSAEHFSRVVADDLALILRGIGDHGGGI